ncbi:MAG: hypothetical protein WA021_05260 [Minisyncoccia bacterium]
MFLRLAALFVLALAIPASAQNSVSQLTADVERLTNEIQKARDEKATLEPKLQELVQTHKNLMGPIGKKQEERKKLVDRHNATIDAYNRECTGGIERRQTPTEYDACTRRQNKIRSDRDPYLKKLDSLEAEISTMSLPFVTRAMEIGELGGKVRSLDWKIESAQKSLELVRVRLRDVCPKLGADFKTENVKQLCGN